MYTEWRLVCVNIALSLALKSADACVVRFSLNLRATLPIASSPGRFAVLLLIDLAICSPNMQRCRRQTLGVARARGPHTAHTAVGEGKPRAKLAEFLVVLQLNADDIPGSLRRCTAHAVRVSSPSTCQPRPRPGRCARGALPRQAEPTLCTPTRVAGRPVEEGSPDPATGAPRIVRSSGRSTFVLSADPYGLLRCAPGVKPSSNVDSSLGSQNHQS